MHVRACVSPAPCMLALVDLRHNMRFFPPDIESGDIIINLHSARSSPCAYDQMINYFCECVQH